MFCIGQIHILKYKQVNKPFIFVKFVLQLHGGRKSVVKLFLWKVWILGVHYEYRSICRAIFMHRVKGDSFQHQGTDWFPSSPNYLREVSGNGISVPVSSSLDTDSLAKMGGHSMGVFRTINWGPYPITIQAIIQDRYSIQKIALITDS